MEIKTGLKGILETVPPRKNTSNASQILLYVITISHFGDLKCLKNGLH